MVNLSHCTTDKTLLDPFCGVGTILQEGLLLGASVIGVDANPWCVEAAQTNLRWLTKEYGLTTSNYKLLHGDSRNLVAMIHYKSVDCVVTEPDLGPALRHFPTERHAEGIIDELKPLYFAFLSEAYQVLRNGGKLVMVTPYIRTRTGIFVTMNIYQEAMKLGFTVAKPFTSQTFGVDVSLPEDLSAASSLIEIGKRHKIGREIHVFQK
jgi:tRNA G10  N-methylase Trm11